MRVWYPGLLAVLGPLLAVACISIVVFARNTDKFPLNRRHPRLVLLSSSVGVVYMTFAVVQRVFPSFPVILFPFVGPLCQGICFICYVVRAWKLYWTWSLTQKQIDRGKNSSHLNSSDGSPHHSRGVTRAVSFRHSRKASLVTQMLPDNVMADAAVNHYFHEKREQELRKIRHYLSRGFVKRLLYGMLSVQLLVLLVPFAVKPPARIAQGFPEEPKDFRNLVGLVTSLQVVVFGLVCIFIAWSFRKIDDGFRIKSEFKFIGVAVIFGGILWQAMVAVFGRDHSYMPSTIALVCVIFFVITFTTGYPLYIMHQDQKGQRARSGAKAANNNKGKIKKRTVAPNGSGNNTNDTTNSTSILEQFRHIVDLFDGKTQFRAFLTTEFSIENLRFFEDVHLLKTHLRNIGFPNLASPDTDGERSLKILQSVAKLDDIRHEYIGRDAPLEVNLPTGVVSTISAFFDQLIEFQLNPESDFFCRQDYRQAAPDEFWTSFWVGDVFDDALQEITDLMVRDSFPRFKRSRFYTLELRRQLFWEKEFQAPNWYKRTKTAFLGGNTPGSPSQERRIQIQN